ncbi:type IV secretory system conjugative DNA transfer family protein [Aphanothece hegewaldii]|uniref:type IV secretory system conjugative DNA transfer family protein n=1 Tax=Aphanothece hegewaldii TaxID=1521625 RepID=UPI001C63A1DB|nr:TraM recognition domain-containing protein [Aphanothece hegewaldii]
MKGIPLIAQNQAVNTNPLIQPLLSPTGLGLLSAFGAVGLLSLLEGQAQKGKLSTSYWAGEQEKARAKAIANTQINQPQRDSVAAYVGTPEEVLIKLKEEWLLKGYRPEIVEGRKAAEKTVYLPDMQRGTAVIGSAGAGKTFTWISSIARSFIDEGLPGILFDCKFPSQTSEVVAYAMKRGYRVYYFCPGLEPCQTVDLLGFLKDAEDSVAAGQLAQVIAKNIDLNANASSDKFFEDAGATLLEAVFLLAKAVGELKGKQFADLMTAAAILSLPNLGKRLEYARSLNKFPVWTMRPAAQIISVSGSPETESSIIGTTERIFQKLLKKDFVGSFCGESELPLALDGKTLVIFGMDRRNRDIVGPLIAAVLHMMINHNVNRLEPREQPLWVSLDELARLYLPELETWFSLNRSDGFCGVIGLQNIAQLEKAYGKELTKIILSNCATKLFMNPQDIETAEMIAKTIGEFDITYSTKSRSRNTGKHGGSSSSRSENRQKRSLYEASQILKMGVGKTIVLNPGYQRGDEAYIPLLIRNKISRHDLAEVKWSKAQWKKILRKEIEQNHKTVSNEQRRQQFEERYQLVESLFPLPPDLIQNYSKSPVSLNEINF